MNNEYDLLFKQVQLENNITKKTIADKIIEQTESEFKGLSQEQKERDLEKKDIVKKIKRLTSLLKKYRNIKNHRLRHLNTERSKKRREIKRKLEFCRMRLQEITIEESPPANK